VPFTKTQVDRYESSVSVVPAQQRVLSTGAQSVRDQRTAASQAPRAFGSNNLLGRDVASIRLCFFFRGRAHARRVPFTKTQVDRYDCTALLSLTICASPYGTVRHGCASAVSHAAEGSAPLQHILKLTLLLFSERALISPLKLTEKPLMHDKPLKLAASELDNYNQNKTDQNGMASGRKGKTTSLGRRTSSNHTKATRSKAVSLSCYVLGRSMLTNLLETDGGGYPQPE
jgi:hypothetical protein